MDVKKVASSSISSRAVSINTQQGAIGDVWTRVDDFGNGAWETGGGGGGGVTSVTADPPLVVTGAPTTPNIGLNTVTIAKGGTNSSAALTGLGAVVVSDGTSIVQGPAGASNQVLHGNSSGPPTYSQVNLSTEVTGTLPIVKGGTNSTTFTGNRMVQSNAGGTALISSLFTGDGYVIVDAGGNYVSQGATPIPTLATTNLSSILFGDATTTVSNPLFSNNTVLGVGSTAGGNQCTVFGAGSSVSGSGGTVFGSGSAAGSGIVIGSGSSAIASGSNVIGNGRSAGASSVTIFADGTVGNGSLNIQSGAVANDAVGIGRGSTTASNAVSVGVNNNVSEGATGIGQQITSGQGYGVFTAGFDCASSGLGQGSVNIGYQNAISGAGHAIICLGRNCANGGFTNVICLGDSAVANANNQIALNSAMKVTPGTLVESGLAIQYRFSDSTTYYTPLYSFSASPPFSGWQLYTPTVDVILANPPVEVYGAYFMSGTTTICTVQFTYIGAPADSTNPQIWASIPAGTHPGAFGGNGAVLNPIGTLTVGLTGALSDNNTANIGFEAHPFTGVYGLGTITGGGGAPTLNTAAGVRTRISISAMYSTTSP